MGEFRMNLTRNTLKDLIKEVVKDNKKPSMILSEMATFASAKNKINNEKKTFAVFSTHRGERNARENREMDIMVREQILNPSGYSWTVVEGGYKETPRDAEQNPIPGAETTSEKEKSYLIFEDEVRPDAQKIQRLFDIASKACEMTGQESFSFGYARKVQDEFAGETEEMFIAIYPAGATSPGEASRVKASWAGPWSSLEEMQHDTGYYTKVRGSKGTFMEEIAALQESIKNTNSTMEKRKLRHRIQALRSLGIK